MTGRCYSPYNFAMGNKPGWRYSVGPFTDKELKVVELAAKGLKSLEIAREMGANKFTTYDRLSAAMRKAGVGDRAALARWAVENALDEALPPENPADVPPPERKRPARVRIKLGRMRRARIPRAS